MCSASVAFCAVGGLVLVLGVTMLAGFFPVDSMHTRLSTMLCTTDLPLYSTCYLKEGIQRPIAVAYPDSTAPHGSRTIIHMQLLRFGGCAIASWRVPVHSRRVGAEPDASWTRTRRELLLLRPPRAVDLWCAVHCCRHCWSGRVFLLPVVGLVERGGARDGRPQQGP